MTDRGGDDAPPDHAILVADAGGPLTYGDYLRVPELLALQSPLSQPEVPDEMLFILVQQVQELWFKQVLYDLRRVLVLLEAGHVIEGVQLLGRITRIIWLLGEEAVVLEAMPPSEFLRFRGVLSSSSGLESAQFRELEWASGLRDPTYLKVVRAVVRGVPLDQRWPRSLRDVFCAVLARLDPDPVAALVEIYATPQAHPDLFLLAEACSDYEVRFGEWRFHHVKVVERAIGDRSAGTAGSAGSGYLGRTLGYRFFPELWEARNRLASRGNARPGHPPH